MIDLMSAFIAASWFSTSLTMYRASIEMEETDPTKFPFFSSCCNFGAILFLALGIWVLR